MNEDQPQNTAEASEENASLQQLVFKLRCKFGHPANDSLARSLRLGGARQPVVEAAKRVKCSTCDRVRPPKEVPKVGVPRADEFNQVVGVDLFYISDCNKTTRMVLSIVDHAATFHVLRWAQGRSPDEIAAVFQEAWIGVLGAPAQVLYDHGGEFTKDFEALLEQVGTQATIIPVESHWRGGLVERHGATAKTIMRKLIDQHSVYEDTAFRCALQETRRFLCWVDEDVTSKDHLQKGSMNTSLNLKWLPWITAPTNRPAL